MLFRIIKSAERACNKLQGKGWGAKTLKHEVKYASKFMHNPVLVVDIGAHRGWYADFLRKRWKDLEIHIFEPAAANCARMRKKYTNDSKMIVNQCALASTAGNFNLYSNTPASILASLTKRDLHHANMEFNIVEPVTAIRFDDYWLEKLGGQVIDFVKLDVEGHELDVLKGFGGAINKTKVLQFEFGGCNIDTRTYFKDFWHFFNQNFKMFRITPFGLQAIKKYSETDEFFLGTNYLCVNRSFN